MADPETPSYTSSFNPNTSLSLSQNYSYTPPPVTDYSQPSLTLSGGSAVPSYTPPSSTPYTPTYYTPSAGLTLAPQYTTPSYMPSYTPPSVSGLTGFSGLGYSSMGYTSAYNSPFPRQGSVVNYGPLASSALSLRPSETEFEPSPIIPGVVPSSDFNERNDVTNPYDPTKYIKGNVTTPLDDLTVGIAQTTRASVS